MKARCQKTAGFIKAGQPRDAKKVGLGSDINLLVGNIESRFYLVKETIE